MAKPKKPPSPAGRIIKSIREAKGLNGYKLSQAAGKGRNALYAIEASSHDPSVTTIYWVAKALGMSPVELFERIITAMEQENCF